MVNERLLQRCSNDPMLHYAMGGINIDAESYVLFTREQLIPALFAAGEVVGRVHGANRLGDAF